MTMMAVDFRAVDDDRDPLPIRPIRNKGFARVTSRKQMRARARRNRKQAGMSEEFRKLYKPIEKWDADELARGRPRAKDGTFGGRAPRWLTREVHEESMTRFRQVIRDGMNENTNTALTTIRWILSCDEVDEKGKPVVSPSTKLDAAKFLVEHVLGKPKQHIETDISVKLQGILASSIITPGTLPAVPAAHALASPRDDVLDAEWSSED